MARILGLAAEIFARLHQARAEEPLPLAIHPHPCRERMIAGDDPLGECQPIGFPSRREWREEGGQPRLDLLPRLVVFAARKHERIPGRPLAHHHGAGERIAKRIEGLPRHVASGFSLLHRPPDLVAVIRRDHPLLLESPRGGGDPQAVAHRRRDTEPRHTGKLRRGRRPSEPEAPEGMPVDHLLPHADPQPGILRHIDRRCGKYGQATRLALVGKMPVDRPALPSPEHARRRPAGLLVVGLGTAKRHWESRRVPRRIDLHLHPAHDDVAVVVAAEAAATGEGRISKQFEANASKRTGGKEG